MWCGLAMLLLRSSSAAAADACSDLVERASPALADYPCSVEKAMADLDARITPRCRAAIQARAATETLSKLAAIAQEQVVVASCPDSHRLLAKYALCRLNPLGLREWLLLGISDGRGRLAMPQRLLTTCLQALQHDGDANAVITAVDLYVVYAQQGLFHRDVLETLLELEREAVMQRLLPLFQESITRNLDLRTGLHELLCDLKDAGRPSNLVTACVASAAADVQQRQREEADRQRQEAARRRGQEEELRTARPIRRGVQVLLTLAAVGVTAVELGYTFGSSDLPTQQALTTLAGVNTGVFTVLDAFALRRRSDVPRALLMSLLLPVGALAGAGIAFGASQHPAGLAVVASTNQAFTLASALAFIWSIPIE